METRFAELERHLDARQLARDDARRGSEMIPQSEVLAKIATLQCRVDDLERIADLDVRFRDVAERVSERLEARFARLSNEARTAPEIPQLLAKAEELQRQIDDCKRVAAQPGPQGPPGKLPRVKDYAAERVHYEADVVVHAGALWQANSDTVHSPPHTDWICLARAGRDGSDGRSPNVCGTYDARKMYQRLDIVAFDGGAFIARRDDPGICPGDGWQLVSRQANAVRLVKQVLAEKRASAASQAQRLFRGNSIGSAIASAHS